MQEEGHHIYLSLYVHYRSGGRDHGKAANFGGMTFGLVEEHNVGQVTAQHLLGTPDIFFTVSDELR